MALYHLLTKTFLCALTSTPFHSIRWSNPSYTFTSITHPQIYSYTTSQLAIGLDFEDASATLCFACWYISNNRSIR
ncbi:hypothetical protein BJ741DRAFT_617246 [Chytriomyces cf. hyalinus JEL632]|nr:hypothetical protein BJ741DRAFT_617246 [Chytriomyces cf. hyalinus JEL632]